MAKADRPRLAFAYEGLDRVIHEKARLSVLTSLVGPSEGPGLRHLKQMCGLTDGNLAATCRCSRRLA